MTILLLLLLSACNFPAPGTTVTAPAQPTDTPAPDTSNTQCGFVWAREPLADLSGEFDAALKVVLPQASGRAEAYGENCLNNQGEVVRFLAMETDFYVNLKVENLTDEQALGELLEKILGVVAQFPVEETPGPLPGYVGVTFEAPADELYMWFPQQEAETALQNGLGGADLFKALQAE